MIRTAVILAAGRGSRLDPGGNATDFSKPLIELGGQTLLERTVASCRSAGAERIVVVTGFRAVLVEADLDRYNRGDIDTVYNVAWRRSNGLSLHVCRRTVREDFVLMMSDHVFQPSILRDLMQLEPRPGTVTLAVDYKLDSVFDMDDATKVLVEHGDQTPRIRDIHKQLAHYNAIDCGLFACTPAIFDALETAMVDGDCSLSDGMGVLGERGDFLAFDIGDRWWQDVDTPEMAQEALNRLGRARTEHSSARTRQLSVTS